jgi:type IV pilus assembly protein PilW
MNILRARRQHGFSLIELMVAITIGMILTMLIGQIFINSRMVFSSTDSLGRLQENARYALSVLTRGVRASK